MGQVPDTFQGTAVVQELRESFEYVSVIDPGEKRQFEYKMEIKCPTVEANCTKMRAVYYHTSIHIDLKKKLSIHGRSRVDWKG